LERRQALESARHQNRAIEQAPETAIMWKLAVGFVAFAAIAIFVVSKADNLDMGGEKHGVETASQPEPARK
jgi:hypothetical protein